MPKKKVTPVITGIRPQGPRKIMALHYHPDTIKQLLHELKEGMKEDVASYYLLTDVEVLVNWALGRLPLVKKPETDESASGDQEREGGKTEQN